MQQPKKVKIDLCYLLGLTRLPSHPSELPHNIDISVWTVPFAGNRIAVLVNWPRLYLERSKNTMGAHHQKGGGIEGNGPRGAIALVFKPNQICKSQLCAVAVHRWHQLGQSETIGAGTLLNDHPAEHASDYIHIFLGCTWANWRRLSVETLGGAEAERGIRQGALEMR
eukprot:scaffold4189_cov36-Prasinocladus_malaysianus.AAC.1